MLFNEIQTIEFSGLNNDQIISVIINTAVFVIALIFSMILIWKIKLPQKGYKLLFIFYTIFWIPLMLLRAYTGSMEKSLASAMIWLPLAAYGFIGIFARIFGDWFSFNFKSRKAFIYLALGIQIITYIPIIIYPCTATNVIQSIGIGIGASCIGSFQLLFNEQYGKSKQFLTVSLLSIPPLLADFVSSPIQNAVISFCPIETDDLGNRLPYDSDVMKYLWVIGLIFVIVGCILAFFIKENSIYFGSDDKYKKTINNKNEWFYFILLAIIGSLIAFVKFANSGSISTLYIQTLSGNTSSSYEGYNSLIFSLSQLIGGLLAGLILIRTIGKLGTFTIGASIWIIYHITIMFTANPISYMCMLSLNGFAYGILYNLVLGFVLQRTFKYKKITPMGAYQSVLSFGIMTSNFLTSWLTSEQIMGVGKDNINEFMNITRTINGVIIGIIIIIYLLFVISILTDKKINIKKQR